MFGGRAGSNLPDDKKPQIRSMIWQSAVFFSRDALPG